MDESALANVFFSSLLIVGLVLFAATLWRSYAIESLQQRLFNLRRELFCFARSGELRFDDPFYREMTLHINSLIHFTPEISFRRVVLTFLYAKFQPNAFHSLRSVRESLVADKTLRDHTKVYLLRVHEKLMLLAAQHIVRTSPVGMTLAIGFLVWSYLEFVVRSRGNFVEAYRRVARFENPPAWFTPGVWGLLLSRGPISRQMDRLENQALIFERAQQQHAREALAV